MNYTIKNILDVLPADAVQFFDLLGDKCAIADRAGAARKVLVEELRAYVSAGGFKLTAAEKNNARAAFVRGYTRIDGATIDAAAKAWERHVLPCIEVKRSAEGERSAARRAAAKAAKPSKAAKLTAPSGEEAADRVQLGLSAAEARLISLIRAGDEKAARAALLAIFA